MNVIQANQDHLPALANLFDAYRVWYRMPSDEEGAYAFLKARMENNESVVFAAESDGELCGFTQLYPLFSSTRMKRLWLLNDLFVKPEYRGQGISKLLLNRAKQLAIDTKAAGLTLETEKSNFIGNQLYPATGFELDSDTHNFYSWDNPAENTK